MSFTLLFIQYCSLPFYFDFRYLKNRELSHSYSEFIQESGCQENKTLTDQAPANT